MARADLEQPTLQERVRAVAYDANFLRTHARADLYSHERFIVKIIEDLAGVVEELVEKIDKSDASQGGFG